MWFPKQLSDAVLDTSADVHAMLSYVLYVVVPLHVLTTSRRAWEVLRGWVGAGIGRPLTDTPQGDVCDKKEDLVC